MFEYDTELYVLGFYSTAGYTHYLIPEWFNSPFLGAFIASANAFILEKI